MESNNELRVSVADGKYTVVHDSAGLRILRFGEPWRDVTGDNVIYSLAAELEALRAAKVRPPLILHADPLLTIHADADGAVWLSFTSADKCTASFNLQNNLGDGPGVIPSTVRKWCAEFKEKQ